MTAQGVLRNLSLNWRSRKPEVTLELDAHIEDVEKLKDKKLSVEIKQYREKRSLDANNYYWQLLTKLADALNVSKPYLHNVMLRRYGQIEVIDGQGVYLVLPDTETAQNKAEQAETYHIKPTSQVKIGKDGMTYRTYMMLRGSSDYDTKEMSQLINGLVGECKDMGIETIPPDEIERMMAAYGKKHNTD